MNAPLLFYETPTSSSSWRVRCALNFKEIAYESKDADASGENDTFVRAVNPAARIPVLVHGERVLIESLAIIEYLDETFGGPKLLPMDSVARAQARAIALHITCAMQPMQNVRVREKVDEVAERETKDEWCQYWMRVGLKELEGMLDKTAGKYCVGDDVSIADMCIPSIVERGRRWDVNVEEFPTLCQIDSNLHQIPAFSAAHPNPRPDPSK